MRVVVAPDSFGGTADAAVVAAALAEGWRAVAPADDLVLRPLSDGGPGLVAILAGAIEGERVDVDTLGPTGAPARVEVFRSGSTAYVESAQACGLAQLQRHGGDVRTATTYGVGAAVDRATRLDGVTSIVVGLGGSGTNDGGAGLWAALGAEPGGDLRSGGIALRRLPAVAAPPPPAARLVAATDVDNPLLGRHGASAVYGPQKGADEAAVMQLDAALEHWADLVEAATARPGLRTAPGAGAAGGLGFGLLALGAQRVSGVTLVMEAVGLAAAVTDADLLVTGEGSLDATSLRGKVVAGAARVGQAAGVPVVVAAGQATVGAREAAAHGLDEVWTVTDLAGSPAAAIAAGTAGIRELGQRLAAAWSAAARRP